MLEKTSTAPDLKVFDPTFLEKLAGLVGTESLPLRSKISTPHNLWVVATKCESRINKQNCRNYKNTLKSLLISYKINRLLNGSIMKKIANLLILLVFCRCAVEPSADTSAIRDQRHVLGMVLIEDGGKQLLEMVICKAEGGKEIGFAELADKSLCRNAFVDADGNNYYFAELTDKDLKHRATVDGYLKLAAVVAIPLVLGVVAGRHSKEILEKVRILKDGKFFFNKKGKEDTFSQVLEEILSDKKLTEQVGFWGGVIAAIVTQHRGSSIVWGKKDRKLVSNWDEIFKVHSRGFEQAKELDDQRAIEQILESISQRLSVKINPEVKF